MSSTPQIRLLMALGSCLRPLVRMLLRAGVGFPQFSELAKIAFVQEAMGERDSRGRTTNISRVAVRTGLSRKEVARLRAGLDAHAMMKESEGARVFHSGHAARVLQLWHSDPAFLDHRGAPRPLAFAGSDVNFGSIVRVAGGDVPPGAVRAELIDAGAVVEDEAGQLRPTKRHFIPADTGEELIVGFSHIVEPVLVGLARNTDEDCSAPFIQRLTYSDRLKPSAVPLFREIARDRASQFVQSVDDWLSSNEQKSVSAEADSLRVGVGVFYYEGPPPSSGSKSPDVSPNTD